jgi:hypothetical protein
MSGRRISLAGVAVAIAIAGCGSSAATKTVIVTTSTVTASASTSSSATTAASVSTTGGAPTSGSAALPLLITMGWSGVEPSTIDFSADGGNIVTGIKWVSWTATGATGDGASGIQSCVPNCAQGTTKQVPTTIVLSDPVNGHFTHLVETRNGTSTADSYSSQETWPIGAQA